MFSRSLKIKNCEDLDVIGGAEVSLLNGDRERISSLLSDSDGTVIIDNLAFDYIRVFKEGYCAKEYTPDSLPDSVSLLPEKPYLYTSTPSAKAGDLILVHYHAPKGGRLQLRLTHPRKNEKSTYILFDIDPVTSEVPDTGLVEEGLDWPYVTARIPKTRSGVWSVEIVSGQEVAAAPLIIRSYEQYSVPRVILVSSVATWMCYNFWGGRNRYRSHEFDEKINGKTPQIKLIISKILHFFLDEPARLKIKKALGRNSLSKPWMRKKISWNRPWGKYIGLDVPASVRTLNHLAALEIKILTWFDRNNIEYECVADLDLEKSPALCARRRIAVLMGHSEYWSVNMYKAIEDFHFNKKMWIVNMSGNSIYRQIEVCPDFSVKLRNLVFALSGNDESSLTGVRFDEHSYGFASPYKVVAPGHWVYEGCIVKKGDVFGDQCLIDNKDISTDDYNPALPSTLRLNGYGAAGFETDKLTKKARSRFTLLARSRDRNTAHVVFSSPSNRRGGAFSMSSINAGGALLVDSITSKMLANVINKALMAHDE